MGVVVVTFNSGGVLPGLLASLPAGLAELNWNLVVADNGSSDDTVDVLRRLAPSALVVETGANLGYAAGVNAALAASSQSRAYLVLNPDVRLGPGAVGHLLAALDETGVGIAVPRLFGADGGVIESLRREPTLVRSVADALVGARRAGRWGTLGEVVSDPAAYTRPGDTDWAEGSTQLISRECLAGCGPWDESYFLYSEETDFHLRAGAAGFRVRFVPEAEATHLEGGSSTSPPLWALLTANRLRFYGRRHGRAATAAYWLSLLVREASRGLLGRAPSRTAFRVLRSPRLLRASRDPRWLEQVSELSGGA